MFGWCEAMRWWSGVERRKAGVVGRRLCAGSALLRWSLGGSRAGQGRETAVRRRVRGSKITLQFRFSVFFKLNITIPMWLKQEWKNISFVSNLWTHALLTFISVGVWGWLEFRLLIHGQNEVSFYPFVVSLLLLILTINFKMNACQFEQRWANLSSSGRFYLIMNKLFCLFVFSTELTI